MPETWFSFGPSKLQEPGLAWLLRLQVTLSRFSCVRRLAVHALAVLSGVLIAQLQWPRLFGPALARASREGGAGLAVVALAAGLAEWGIAGRFARAVESVADRGSEAAPPRRTPT